MAMEDDIGADDDIGAAIYDVGAPRRRFRARRRAGLRRPPLKANIPGAPPIAEKQIPLGFGSTAFTATSGSTLTLTARPQCVFRGRRLVIDFARTGASATGLLTVSQLAIGTRNQLASTGPIGVAAFGPGAFGVDLLLDPAEPGIDLTLVLAISASPTATDRVDVNATLIGAGIQ